MKVATEEIFGVQSTVIELTRTNLLTLLAKLDGTPSNSACTIGHPPVWVRAVEDEAHYADRERGEMHPDTEAMLASPRFSWTQAICDDCWNKKNPGRTPIRVVALGEEVQCCYCGDLTISGIWVRDDPANVSSPRLKE